MSRPFVEAVRAWIALLPAVLRVLVRRARNTGSRQPDPGVIAGSSTASSFSCEIGPERTVMVDGRAVGRLSTHDDGGTSTAEYALVLDAGTPADVVRLVIDTSTAAGFERGNHRACWRVADVDDSAISVLRESGFIHEGKAPPLAQDPNTWQAWARLSTDGAIVRGARSGSA